MSTTQRRASKLVSFGRMCVALGVIFGIFSLPVILQGASLAESLGASLFPLAFTVAGGVILLVAGRTEGAN